MAYVVPSTAITSASAGSPLTLSLNVPSNAEGWTPVPVAEVMPVTPPGRSSVVSEIEVASVVRAPLEELLDPAHRFTVRHPSGYRGPGFESRGLFVWGFTALLLTSVFDAAGLTRDWDRGVTRPIPKDLRPSLGEVARVAARRMSGR